VDQEADRIVHENGGCVRVIDEPNVVGHVRQVSRAIW
jgi:hypothetical protein